MKIVEQSENCTLSALNVELYLCGLWTEFLLEANLFTCSLFVVDVVVVATSTLYGWIILPLFLSYSLSLLYYAL